MSGNSKSSATSKSEKAEKYGPSSSKVIEIGPIGESILQQVEQLVRLINVSASTSTFQDVGQPRRLSTLQSRTPMLQRRPSAIASIRAIFDSSITPSPTPSDILQSEIRQYSADELSNGFSAANPPTSDRQNISMENSRGRKVYPQDETAIHDSPKDSQQANEIRSEALTTPPSVPSQAASPLLIGRRRSNLASFAEGGSGRRRSSVVSSAEGGSGRRSSVASLGEGAFGGRRDSYSSFAESVVSVAQSLSKMLHKSSNDEAEEKRQAKIAELVDKEVMVLNAAQLAQIQQRNTHPFTISVNSPFRHW